MKNLYKSTALLLAFLSVFGTNTFAAMAISPVAGDVTGGLIAHWTFDEGSGSTAADSSGISTPNDLTLVNDPAWVSSGEMGGAISFDGGSDFAVASGSGANGTFGDLNSFTVATWVKTTYTGRADLINNFDTTADTPGVSATFAGFGLVMNPDYTGCTGSGTIGLWVGDTTNGYACANSDLSDGNWHYVIGTWDGTTATVYVDGVQVESTTSLTDPNLQNSIDLTLNYNKYNTDGTSAYNGDMDDVRIYDRALSSDEVSQLYSFETAPAVVPPPQPATITVNVSVSNTLGTAVASDFIVDATGTNISLTTFNGSATGTVLTLDPGPYSIMEEATSTYQEKHSAGCVGTASSGDTIVCNLFDNDESPYPPAYLTVITDVVNNNGGTAVPSDFTINALGPDISTTTFAGSTPGTVLTYEPGNYEIDGSNSPLYTRAESPDCIGQFVAGDSATCTIIYDDIAATSTINNNPLPPLLPPTINSNDTGNPDSGNTGSVIPSGNSSNDSNAGGSIVPPTAPSNSSSDTDQSGGTPSGISTDASSTSGGAGGNGSPSLSPFAFGVTNDASNSSNGTSTSNTNDSNNSNGSGGASSGGGSVLPAACSLLTTPMRFGQTNDPVQVSILQQDLNHLDAAGLTVSGNFDQATLAAVQNFQAEHSIDVLSPWGTNIPTGYVSFLTIKELNKLNCGQDIPLSPQVLAFIAAYKEAHSAKPSEFTIPDGVNTSSTTDVGQNSKTNPNQPQTASAGGVPAGKGVFSKIGGLIKSIFN